MGILDLRTGGSRPSTLDSSARPTKKSRPHTARLRETGLDSSRATIPSVNAILLSCKSLIGAWLGGQGPAGVRNPNHSEWVKVLCCALPGEEGNGQLRIFSTHPSFGTPEGLLGSPRTPSNIGCMSVACNILPASPWLCVKLIGTSTEVSCKYHARIRANYLLYLCWILLDRYSVRHSAGIITNSNDSYVLCNILNSLPVVGEVLYR